MLIKINFVKKHIFVFQKFNKIEKNLNFLKLVCAFFPDFFFIRNRIFINISKICREFIEVFYALLCKFYIDKVPIELDYFFLIQKNKFNEYFANFKITEYIGTKTKFLVFHR